MTTAATGRRRRAPAFDLDAYQRELVAFNVELAEAQHAALTGEPPAQVALIYARHEPLFSRTAVDALEALRGGGGDPAGLAAALLPFAAEGYAERQVVELSDRIAAAEARAVIIWRGERIPYRALPARIADISERSERNALDASYREAVEAINPLREARLAGLRGAWRELGHEDSFALARWTRGLEAERIIGQMRTFLVESETPYFAALRRFLAELDIEQGDASIADLWHVLRGAGWDAWFAERNLRVVLEGTLAGLGLQPGGRSGLTVELQPAMGDGGLAACVALAVPGDVRIILRHAGGQADYRALLHQVGHAETYAHASADAAPAYRYAGDGSIGEASAWLFESLMLEPDWLTTELGMSEAEQVGWLDFAAFRALYQVRRTIAGLLFEQRLYSPGGMAMQRAYYAGTFSLLVGVRHPESGYLAEVPDKLRTAQRFRSWCAGASLGDWLRQQHGSEWWRNPTAGVELRQSWSGGQGWNAEALVAHLGYDDLDWRPILRQIRTHLIGEMSGYGGPNITTRAGTRKV